MPQSKNIEPLKKLSLYSVAYNMKNLWCRDYLENYASQGRYLYIIGPFDCLR